MNSIATPRRIEFDAQALARALGGRGLRIALSTLVLCILLISLRPFGLGMEGLPATGGDPVNQIGFSIIGVLSLLAMLSLADRRVIAGLADIPLLVMFTIVLLSLVTGLGSSAGLRVFLFTFFAIAGVGAVLVVPMEARSLATVIGITAAVVLLLSYGGLILLPEKAIHQGYEQESIHAGLWRGVFTHKNIAGPVMATLTFAGLLLMRTGRTSFGFMIAAAAGLFVLNTGSKTSAGIVPLAAMIVLLPGLIGQRWLTSFLALLTLALFLTFTVGMVLNDGIRDVVDAVAPGTTYTGRTSLWTFMAGRIAENPWFGVGLENFWKTPALLDFERTWYLAWDVRGSVHGHNGYMDVVMALGIPAAIFFGLVMILRPAINYAQTPRYRTNVIFSDFFMMIFIFTALNACLESFFFRRADPVWLMFFMSVLGLKLCARFYVARDSKAA